MTALIRRICSEVVSNHLLPDVRAALSTDSGRFGARWNWQSYWVLPIINGWLSSYLVEHIGRDLSVPSVCVCVCVCAACVHVFAGLAFFDATSKYTFDGMKAESKRE